MTTPARCENLIVKENWFKRRATIGSGPSQCDGDDHRCLWPTHRPKQKIATFHTLRQQLAKRRRPLQRRVVGFHRA